MLHYILPTLILAYLIILIIYSTTEEVRPHFRRPLLKIAKVKNTRSLPRRPSNYTLRVGELRVRRVPSWDSCPPATTSSAIWSMAASKARSPRALSDLLFSNNSILNSRISNSVVQAEARYSAVLGMSILETWDYSRTLPDLRLIVIVPTVLHREALGRLEEIGWGICYIKRLDYLKFGESKYGVTVKLDQSGETLLLSGLLREAPRVEHDPVREAGLGGQ